MWDILTPSEIHKRAICLQEAEFPTNSKKYISMPSNNFLTKDYSAITRVNHILQKSTSSIKISTLYPSPSPRQYSYFNSMQTNESEGFWLQTLEDRLKLKHRTVNSNPSRGRPTSWLLKTWEETQIGQESTDLWTEIIKRSKKKNKTKKKTSHERWSGEIRAANSSGMCQYLYNFLSIHLQGLAREGEEGKGGSFLDKWIES